MGLGKTVEILALVLACAAPPNVISGTDTGVNGNCMTQSRGTLVVCKVCPSSYHFSRISHEFWKVTSDFTVAGLSSLPMGAGVHPPMSYFVNNLADVDIMCSCSYLNGYILQEARSKLADPNVQIIEYHGGNRIRNIKKLAQHDIVSFHYTLPISASNRYWQCILGHVFILIAFSTTVYSQGDLYCKLLQLMIPLSVICKVKGDAGRTATVLYSMW